MTCDVRKHFRDPVLAFRVTRPKLRPVQSVFFFWSFRQPVALAFCGGEGCHWFVGHSHALGSIFQRACSQHFVRNRVRVRRDEQHSQNSCIFSHCPEESLANE